MAEKLYRRLTFPSLGKVYVPAVRGRHVVRTFKRASDAETHARKLRERYARLRAAQQVIGGQQVPIAAG